MREYLKPTDTDAFKDLVLKDAPHPAHGMTHLCPVCQGYGGWNLRLDAYGPGKHFRAGCSQCMGWGWVSDLDLCIHAMRELSQVACRERGIRHHGMCWHVYECQKCGRIQCTDSSG